MKRFSIGLLIGLLIGVILTIPMYSLAQQPIKLIINGQQIQCDVPPQNINGRILVPARFIAEPLGAKVEWDGLNRAVIINSKVSQEQIQTPTQTQDNSMQNNNVKTNLPKEEPKSNNTNNTPMVDGYVDANNNGTPDWVESQPSKLTFPDEPKMN